MSCSVDTQWIKRPLRLTNYGNLRAKPQGRKSSIRILPRRFTLLSVLQMIRTRRPLYYSYRLTLLLDHLHQTVPNSSKTLQPMFSLHPFAHFLLRVTIPQHTHNQNVKTSEAKVCPQQSRADRLQRNLDQQNSQHHPHSDW